MSELLSSINNMSISGLGAKADSQKSVNTILIWTLSRPSKLPSLASADGTQKPLKKAFRIKPTQFLGHQNNLTRPIPNPNPVTAK
ncbi:hypothetical protein GCM10009114_26770 [Aliiglaciecola litoralis]|uniref:Uncharacterized protein n=1 Tax=Aliiglaciecola litoralis TaxID=582857 RepID=A0ABP3WZK4_9ALTE